MVADMDETTISTTAATTQPVETIPETMQPVTDPEETSVPETTVLETVEPETMETAAYDEPAETLDYEISETTEFVPEETVAMTTEPVYIEVIQDSAMAVAQTNLFGAFLICGTLVGIFLLRGRYGT